MVSLWTFDVALFFSVFIHEVGHALMAMMLRVLIMKFRFGFGPLLFRIGVFELRLVPISGEMSTEERMIPWKGALIALAGVMMQWEVVIAAMLTGIAKMDVAFWAWARDGCGRVIEPVAGGEDRWGCIICLLKIRLN